MGVKVMERTVKFVGLDDRERARGRQQEIAAIVTQHAAQEGIAADAAAVQDVGRHARGRGLAVGTGKTQSTAVSRHDAQQGGALDDLKAMLAEVGQPLMAIGHGRGIDHQRVLRVTAIIGNEGGILVKVDVYPLVLQGCSQVARRAVIAGNTFALSKKIAL